MIIFLWCPVIAELNSFTVSSLFLVSRMRGTGFSPWFRQGSWVYDRFCWGWGSGKRVYIAYHSNLTSTVGCLCSNSSYLLESYHCIASSFVHLFIHLLVHSFICSVNNYMLSGCCMDLGKIRKKTWFLSSQLSGWNGHSSENHINEYKITNVMKRMRTSECIWAPDIAGMGGWEASLRKWCLPWNLKAEEALAMQRSCGTIHPFIFWPCDSAHFTSHSLVPVGLFAYCHSHPCVPGFTN